MSSHVPYQGVGQPWGTWDELPCLPGEHGTSSHVRGGGEREITQGETWDELPCKRGGRRAGDHPGGDMG